MREAADAREKFLQEELARMKRRSEQRVRLLQERMDRKDLSMATELTTQQVTAQKKEKSFEIELGRRRREISEKDERYDQDTSTLRAEIHALRDNVSSQRDQISGISKDLAIFSKAMVVMDNQRAVDSQTIVELTQKTLRPAEPDSPNDLLATLETEPELEPAQDERTASAEQPGMGDTWAHSTRSGFGMQSKLAPQPQHLDTLAQLYSTQATLDFTQAQCTKQRAAPAPARRPGHGARGRARGAGGGAEAPARGHARQGREGRLRPQQGPLRVAPRGDEGPEVLRALEVRPAHDACGSRADGRRGERADPPAPAGRAQTEPLTGRSA